VQIVQVWLARWSILLILGWIGPQLVKYHFNASERTGIYMAEAILEATAIQLKTAQAKITYLGEQTKPIATVVFSTEGYGVEINRFLKVQTSPEPYMNDGLPYTKYFTVTSEEFHRILSAVKPVVVKREDFHGRDFLSFSVTRETGTGIEGQEFCIGSHTGKEFYEKLIAALAPENHLGREILTKQFVNVLPQ